MEPAVPAQESELEFNEAIDIALTFFLFAVIIGAVLKWVYSFFKKPLPLAVAIFVVGGLLALIADRARHGIGLITESLLMAEAIHPNLIFFVLLPPLLFEAASLTDWPVFRRVFAQSIWLAAPGALVSTAFMGIFVYIIFNFILTSAGWSLSACLMFCSMFAATDTVAVVTTLDSLGVPNRVSAPIVGESLLNDASAIVLFQIFKGLVTGAFSPTFGAIMGKFLQLALGGVAWGYACALVVSTMLTWVNSDAAVEITILFAGSYVAYFLADVQFHVSGVLAVIVYGLFMSAKGMYVVSPDVAKFEESFKSQVAFFCNTLMFFVGGVVSFHRVMCMPEITGDWSNWVTMIGLFGLLLLARVVMVAALWPILTRTGYGMQLAEAKILIWAGLRGTMTVALALAMDLDQTIDKSTKDLMIFHLAGLTCMSLVINGTTIDKFYLYLDIHPPNPYRSVMFDKAMAEIECTHVPEIVRELQDDPFFASVDWVTVRQLVLDMTKAKIDGRSRPEFPDDDGMDPYAAFASMLDRRHKRGLKMAKSSEDSHIDTGTVGGGNMAHESIRMNSATITFGYLKRFEQHQARKQRRHDNDEIELIVSPRGRNWKNESRTASTLEPQPIDELFGPAQHQTAVEIDLSFSDDDDHGQQDADAGAESQPESDHKRPEPKQQLQNLRDWALALKLKQRIGRRRELISDDERNAQIVLTLFAALKADFREQFESHHVSHEAVWMLFDAANDGCDACDVKRPTLAMPFRAEWSSLSVRLENNLISPILRNGQKFKLMRALGNWILLQNMFVSLEVLHAFIESHITVVEKVSKEVLVDPTAINKILKSVVEKAEALLCDHGQAMPAFFSVVVTVLAARRLLHWKRQKLLSLSQEGVINQKDMIGLISAIDIRLQMLSASTTLFRISQIRALDRERSKLIGAAGAVFANRNRELIKKKIAKVMKKTKLRRDAESYRELEGDSTTENFERNVMTRVADTVVANHKTVRYDEKSFEEVVDYGSDYSL